ncbi:ROK family protein [soil metagenome]
MLGLKIQDNADFAAEIIRKVREHNGLSRVEVARVLGVAASTIGRHVDALVAEGYFEESVEPTKEAGRPPTRLHPNPRSGCYLGVDFHADMMFLTAVNFAQQPIAHHRVKLNSKAGVDAVMQQIIDELKLLRRKTRLPLLAIGLALPGRVSTMRGIGIKYVHIPGWEDVPVVAQVSKALKAPAFVENNIRTMALAERWFGEAQGCQDLICLGVRYGVSAGVIRNGELATGHRELGGEIRGWNCPVFDGSTNEWIWRAGDTIEKNASMRSALDKDAALRGRLLEIEEFIDAVNQNDAIAVRVMTEVASIHGWIISQMVQLIDPEIVVLAGPLTSLGDHYVDTVRSVAVKFESDYHPSVPIRISSLGEHAGSVGAAALALEKWRPKDII